MITSVFSNYIAKNILCYSNEKKIFFLNRTNVHNNSIVYALKNTHGKNNIRRVKHFNKLFFEKKIFYINKSIERKFFANNIFRMNEHQPFVVSIYKMPQKMVGIFHFFLYPFHYLFLYPFHCLFLYLFFTFSLPFLPLYKDIYARRPW